MPKRNLTATERFELRQIMHVATLEALLASRRWSPGDLVFQGGTSLHLAHGSPRFSEDLDFLVDSSLSLGSIGKSIERRLAGSAWLPADAALKVTKAKDGHNPHAFDVAVGGENMIGSVKVKVEMWAADKDAAIAPLRISVVPVRLTSGPQAGMQAFVPAADLQEIHADKIFAVAARPYLKPRDVFDLHWLRKNHAPGEIGAVTLRDMQTRLATYPNTTLEAWLQAAAARRVELQSAAGAVLEDLKRWLPPSWPLSRETVQEMLDEAVRALDEGVAVMQLLHLQVLLQSPGGEAPGEQASEHPVPRAGG
jgi:predicted nucleotidyltransferase component of viral defense system